VYFLLNVWNYFICSRCQYCVCSPSSCFAVLFATEVPALWLYLVFIISSPSYTSCVENKTCPCGKFLTCLGLILHKCCNELFNMLQKQDKSSQNVNANAAARLDSDSDCYAMCPCYVCQCFTNIFLRHLFSATAELIFTKLSHMVVLGAVRKPSSWIYSCPYIGQKWQKFAYFRLPLLSHLKAEEYCNSKINWLSTRTCLLYTCARFGELWPTNHWHRGVIITKFVEICGSVYISGMAQCSFEKLLHVVDLGFI